MKFSTMPVSTMPVGFTPTFNPDALAKTTKEIVSNPTIELGLDNFYNQVSQNLDYGIDLFYNRGEILNEKGFAEFERIILKDDQVVACLERLKLSTLQLGFFVQAKNESPQAEELKAFWEYVFAEMDGVLQDALYQLYIAIIFGYSISEINFKRCETGSFSGKWIIKDIKNKKQGVYQFELDPFGNILAVTNLWEPLKPLPPEKFIILTWKKQYSNPYGQGLGEILWSLCWLKKQTLKNCAIGNQKWANPTIYISLPESPDKEQITAARNFANDIQNSSAGTLPEPLKAQLLEVANRAQNPNLEFIAYLNDAIAKTISLQVATSTNSQYGTYGAKEIEASSGLIQERFLIQASQELIKEQIIRRITPVNFDKDLYPIDIYPDVVFNPTDTEDKTALVSRIEKLHAMGFISEFTKADRDKVRGIDDFQEEEEEDFGTLPGESDNTEIFDYANLNE